MICLPGLTRNARDFAALCEVLARDDDSGPPMRVIALESRGRGRSEYGAPQSYTLQQELDDLIRALDAWQIRRAHFVGTSRGGLLMMFLATLAPERIDRAVLNDIGPRVEVEGLARIGKGVGMRMAYPSFEALAETLRAGLGAQFPRLKDDQWMRLAQQLASPDAEGGGVRYDYDPHLGDTFRDDAPPSAPLDFWPAFQALATRPVLVIRGANSDILSAATVEAMRMRGGRTRSFVVSGEGHAPLLWDRRAIDTVKCFLSGDLGRTQGKAG